MGKAKDWLLAQCNGIWAFPNQSKQGGREDWGPRFSRERTCGNSRIQLKTEISRGVHEELMEFPCMGLAF